MRVRVCLCVLTGGYGGQLTEFCSRNKKPSSKQLTATVAGVCRCITALVAGLAAYSASWIMLAVTFSESCPHKTLS